MTLVEMIRFEWRYHTRQMSFVASALLFGVFGFALSAAGFGPANLAVNSPFSIMQTTGVLSLLSLFVLAVFCANAIVRDREHRMDEIVFSTPVEKLPFLFARFSGAFLAASSAFCFALVGMILALFAAGHDPARIAPFSLSSYLWALVVMALPNLLVATVVIFAVSAVTRSLLAGAVSAVLIYVVYFVVSALTNSPLMASSVAGASSGPSLTPLLDPFGLSAFFKVTEHWTAVERNRDLLPLRGVFLGNRLLWMAIAATASAGLYRLFSFRLLEPSRRKRRLTVAEPEAATAVGGTYEPVAAAIGPRAQFAAYRSATWLEVRSFITTLPFFALVILWMALALSEISATIDSAEYGAALHATSALAAAAIQLPLHLVGLIILVYFSAEMVWRERSVRMDGIVSATPADSAVFVLAKWSALAVLVLLLVAVGNVAVIVSQLARGWTAIDAAALGGYSWFGGAPLLVFAALTVFVHTLAPNKYAGMVISAAAAIVMKAADLAGIQHPLWRFASGPAVAWSDFYGFGPFAAPFNRFMLHWSVAAALCLVMAIALWRRRASRRLTVLAALLVIAFAFSTAAIYRQTNGVNRYESAEQSLAWRADYERKYARFESLPQPRIVGIRADVDLFPERQTYRIAGTLTLRNETTRPIDRLLISVRRDVAAARIEPAAATLAETDARFRHSWYTLQTPLAPSATTSVEFDLTFRSSGFAQEGPDPAIASNGSLVMSSRTLPVFGYRKGYELRDPSDRRRAGLPPAEPLAGGGDVDVAQEWVDADFTISCPADQVAVTSGGLSREWVREGRRFRRFQSDGRIANGFAFAAARYAVSPATEGAVAIEVYHHPDHSQNVDRIIAAAKASLALFGKSFGPYPHAHLRIVEAPAPGNSFGGYALPGMVLLHENRGFLVDGRRAGAESDLVTRRTAHEVAHQWWGRLVTPALVEGGPMITESLAKYAELLVVESIHGAAAVRASLSTELDQYLTARTRDPEPEAPLARAGAKAYIYYAKGAIVLHAIADLLGEEAFDAVLQTFIAEEGGPGRAPVAQQLVERLSRAAAEDERQLIDQWCNRVVLYDLRMESASARRLGDGRYEITMKVVASKSDLEQGPLPFDEEIEVALFAADERVIDRARHRLHRGQNSVTVVAGELPETAVVDPWVLRVDRNRFDNSQPVE